MLWLQRKGQEACPDAELSRLEMERVSCSGGRQTGGGGRGEGQGSPPQPQV